MIAQSRISDDSDSTDTLPFDGEPDIQPVARYVEPVTPSDADERQVRALAPAPDRLALIAGGVTAVTLGGAVGYWLGRRSGVQARRKIGRTAAAIEHAAELAPVAMQLLGNPLIRTLAIRMLMRQVSRRIPS